MMEVEIEKTPAIRIGSSRELFDFEPAPFLWSPYYDVGDDGKTFILVRPIEPVPGIVVVQNWLGAAR